MKKTDATVSRGVPTVSKYSVISTDVWVLFKKYLPTDADLTPFANDVDNLYKKYKNDPEYEFMKRLLKVYFDELKRTKG